MANEINGQPANPELMWQIAVKTVCVYIMQWKLCTHEMGVYTLLYAYCE